MQLSCRDILCTTSCLWVREHRTIRSLTLQNVDSSYALDEWKQLMQIVSRSSVFHITSKEIKTVVIYLHNFRLENLGGIWLI